MSCDERSACWTRELLLVSAYIKINIDAVVPFVVVCKISLYYYPKVYDDLNNFKFFNVAKEVMESKLFPFGFAMHLRDLKAKYMLPLTLSRDVFTNELTGIYKHVSEATFNYNENVEISMDKEYIYYVLDSFLVNAFVETFTAQHFVSENETIDFIDLLHSNYYDWCEKYSDLFSARPGFKCVGTPLFSNKQNKWKTTNDIIFNMWLKICEVIHKLNNTNKQNLFLYYIDKTDWIRFIQHEFCLNERLVAGNSFFNCFVHYNAAVLTYQQFKQIVCNIQGFAQKIFSEEQNTINERECLYQILLYLLNDCCDSFGVAVIQRIKQVITTYWEHTEANPYNGDLNIYRLEEDHGGIPWREIYLFGDTNSDDPILELRYELYKFLSRSYFHSFEIHDENYHQIETYIDTFLSVFKHDKMDHLQVFHAVHVADNKFSEGRDEIIVALNESSVAAIWWTYPRFYG